jgi:hypothetical protein
MGANRTRDWAKLRQDWLAGKYLNLADMAKRRRIPLSSLHKRSASEKWMERREKVEERTEEIVVEKKAEMQATRRVEIIEKQLKYAQVLIGLSLNTFRGKKKLKRESDGISMLRLALETQMRALKELRDGEEAPIPEFKGGDLNVNVNIANVSGQFQDLSNEQITLRRKQLDDERKRLEGIGEE